MKRLIFFLILIGFTAFFGLKVIKDKVKHDLSQPVKDAVLTPTPTIAADPKQISDTTTSVFVPYWALSKEETFSGTYNQYIYFGVTPDTNGIDEEAGSSRIEQFASSVPDGKSSLLTLRMVDSQTNSAILKDKAIQKKIIDQTVTLAHEHGFSGVVLDLEMSAIPFDALIQQINSFNKDLAASVKKNNLSYNMTLYGDTFYRIRPFDVKTLSQQTDSILIMAYDFNKSRANPGPNFPLNGQETYGYDMHRMIDDMERFVPAKKITVIFGMFGYDWVVDNNGKATAQGVPLTYDQIKKKFLDSCDFTACHIKRDKTSAETTITYTDDGGKKHVVWYEDMQSVATKEQYLRQRGISSFSFWAYSYF